MPNMHEIWQSLILKLICTILITILIEKYAKQKENYKYISYIDIKISTHDTFLE